MVALAAKVVKGQTLRMKNRATQEEQQCKVVYLGPASGGKAQVGVDFTSSAPDFWRIAFPPEDGSCPPPIQCPPAARRNNNNPEALHRRRRHSMNCVPGVRTGTLYPEPFARGCLSYCVWRNCTGQPRVVCPTEQLDPPHQANAGVQSGKFRMGFPLPRARVYGPQSLAIQSHKRVSVISLPWSNNRIATRNDGKFPAGTLTMPCGVSIRATAS